MNNVSIESEANDEPSFIDQIREALELSLCNAIKFCYGYLFGAIVWSIIIKPYGRFYNFESNYYNLPEFIFSLSIAFIFMSFLWARNVMVLFLPSLIGNATQNYIIIALFVALFSNPFANLASNSVESIRVIGCSLTMTFEELKERAKLLLNPIIEVLKDTEKTDLVPIKGSLMDVKQVVDDMLTEVQFSHTQSALKDNRRYQPPKSVANILRQGKRIPEWTPEFSERAKAILGNSSSRRLNFDFETLSFKANVDTEELRNFMRANLTSGKFQLNLTEVLYENCLAIFREAKSSCEDAVEDLRLGCQHNIGPYLAALWCSPVSFSLETTCPWIMNQIINEDNLCRQMNDAIVTAKVDPFNIMGNKTIDQVYANLTQQIDSLNENLIGVFDHQVGVPKRLELNIQLNSKTRNLFISSRNLYRFITDKYKMRKFFLDILLFIYEIYTTITFVSVLRQAYRYHKRYMDDVKFDNHYITGIFIDLDQKRRAIGKRSVLPLTREESDKYISAFTCKRRTSEERHTQRVNCTLIIVFLIFFLSLLYFDNIFYSILMSIHQHAMIKIKEVGSHQLDVRVDGEGSLARLVKRLTRRFNSIYDLNRDTSTKKCLPQPLKTGTSFYAQFSGLVIAYVFIDQISIYAMRFRRLTAAYFYPEKEKRRTIYLYNSILINRQRIEQTGLRGYSDMSQDNDTNREKQGDDDTMFTVKDAIKYLGSCVQDSITCRCIRQMRKR